MIFTGNVNLDPTFTNSFDVGYLKRWDTFTLNSSVYYQHSINAIEFVSRENGNIINGIPVIIKSPINLSSEDRYGIEFTTNYNLSKKVKFFGGFNFFKSKTDGTYSYKNIANNAITQNFANENSSWRANLNSIITLPNKIQWQTKLRYRGSQTGALSNRKGVFTTNIAFGKDILKNKGTLSLNIQDLFNSRKRIITSYQPNKNNPSSISNGEFQWRERQITLNFTYRFNQKKKKKRPTMESDGDDFEG